MVLALSDRPFRVLSFDGGGVHAVSYLPVLHHLECHLQQTVCASQQFEMLVGTSTGAIVATALKLGCPAENVLDLYRKHAGRIFSASWLSRALSFAFYQYHPRHLRAILAEFIRRHTGTTHDVTWEELAADERFAGTELVVTLWNVRREQRAYLSTNRDRPGQSLELWQAPVADIITACCSAPYYFPARRFDLPEGGTAVYCDGGLTGLNNPSVFGVSLVVKELHEQARQADVLSFGAGEITSEHSVSRLRIRTIYGTLKNVIDSLLKSGGALMDRFYEVFGPALPIRKYFRTNHPRTGDLANWKLIPVLEKNFEAGKLTYQLYSNENDKIVNFRNPATVEGLVSVWRDEFGLVPAPERGVPKQSAAEAAAEGVVGGAVEKSSLPGARDVDAASASTQPARRVTSTEVAPWFALRWLVSLVPELVVLLFVSTVWFAWSAYQRQQELDKARGILLVRAIANRALAQDDPELGAILALQAHEFNERFKAGAADQVDRALRHALQGRNFSHALYDPSGPYKKLYTVAYHPQGNWLALGGATGGVKLWHVADSAFDPVPVTLPGHPDQTNALRFSPDGRWLLSATSDEQVRLWDVSSPRSAKPGPTVRLPAPDDSSPLAKERGINFLAFGHSGSIFAAAGNNGVVGIWELATADTPPRLVHAWNTHNKVWECAFSPDDRWMAAVAGEGSVRIWHLQDQQETRLPAPETPGGKRTTLSALAFTPRRTDGRVFLAAGESMDVLLWEVTRPTKLEPPLSVLRGHLGGINTLAYSPDGQTLASGSDDATVRLWDVGHPESPRVVEVLSLHKLSVRDLAFRADGRQLATVGYDGSIRIWELGESRSGDHALVGHTARVHSVAVDRDGRRLVSGSADKTVRLWNLDTLDSDVGVSSQTLETCANVVWSVAWHGDGKYLARGCADGTVRLWDLGADPPVGHTLRRNVQKDASGKDLPTDSALSVAFSDDGNWLAAGGGKTVELWDLRQGTPQAVSALPTQLPNEQPFREIISVAFTADHRYVGAGLFKDDKRDAEKVVLWDLSGIASGGSVTPTVLRRDGFGVWPIATQPNGGTESPRWLAAGGYDAQVLLWDQRYLDRPATSLIGHGSSVMSLAFHPRRPQLATGSLDRTVQLWNLSDLSAAPAVLHGHVGPVLCVAFSPDGKWLASGGNDGRILVQPAQVEDLAQRLRNRVWRNLTQLEWTHWVASDMPYEKTLPGLPSLPTHE